MRHSHSQVTNKAYSDTNKTQMRHRCDTARDTHSLSSSFSYIYIYISFSKPVASLSALLRRKHSTRTLVRRRCSRAHTSHGRWQGVHHHRRPGYQLLVCGRRTGRNRHCTSVRDEAGRIRGLLACGTAGSVNLRRCTLQSRL